MQQQRPTRLYLFSPSPTSEADAQGVRGVPQMAQMTPGSNSNSPGGPRAQTPPSHPNFRGEYLAFSASRLAAFTAARGANHVAMPFVPPSAALARPASASITGRPTSSSTARPLSSAILFRPASPRCVLPPRPSSPMPSLSPRPSLPSVSAAVPSSSGTASISPCVSPIPLVPTINLPSPSTSNDSLVSPGHSDQPVNKGLPKRLGKRPIQTVSNGKEWESKENDFLCPICYEICVEAHITKCGHTYCHECIVKSIEFNPHCPTCSVSLTKEQVAPNYLVVQLIAKQERPLKQVKTDFLEAGMETKNLDVCKFFAKKANDLKVGDIDLMLTMLHRRREILTHESKSHQRELLLTFLSELHKIKRAEKSTLDNQVKLLESDLKSVVETPPENIRTTDANTVPESGRVSPGPSGRGFNTHVPNTDNLSDSMAGKKLRVHNHFNELVDIYLETRGSTLYEDNSDADSMLSGDESSCLTESLDDFGSTLMKVSRYHGLKPLATFSYSADLISNSNIVSSIEFDKDNEYFAIAGVTRKIKLFEYATVIGADVDIHCPNAELGCTAKISCIGWSNYYKNKLASSDYDGCVSLWDTAVALKTATMSEHEKRVWSVDWSNGDPRLFASGSDDTKVKLWSTNQEKSVITLDSKANVCCVKFCPENTFHIAFGSADHCVHYYDLRNTREPMGTLIGHKKAVSYVKFLSTFELVSASTDSNLKLWDLTTLDPIRSFRGHINEKNFVGLATDGDYIACGSENNSLYVYYKRLPKPLFSFKFDNHQSMIKRPTQDDNAEFVSAVAWKKGSPVVVAANSQGAIKVLEMQ